MILVGTLVLEHFIAKLQEISTYVYTNAMKQRLFTSMELVLMIVPSPINTDTNGAKTSVTIPAFMVGTYIGTEVAKLIVITLYCELIETISIIAIILAR